MNLRDLLIEKKAVVLEKWFNEIVETYPPDTAEVLKSKKGRFINPVGYTTKEEIGHLFEGLLNGVEAEEVSSSVDRIVRIRAVQDFSPSEAISFMFLLKKVIRSELEENFASNPRIYQELLAFESQIDKFALFCFDIYMKCREKIYEIKADEVKRSVFTLLKKAKLIYDLEGSNNYKAEQR